jgi:hypothetical protein
MSAAVVRRVPASHTVTFAPNGATRDAHVAELPPVTSLVTRLCSFKRFRTQKQGQSGTEAILICFLGSDRKELAFMVLRASALISCG